MEHSWGLGMPTSLDLQARAKQVRVQGDTLTFVLVDGRVLSVPLSWFPRLLNATQAERDDWRLIGDGEGIHWKSVDEDISVPLLLGLPCE
jgi:hypothetical protein